MKQKKSPSMIMARRYAETIKNRVKINGAAYSLGLSDYTNKALEAAAFNVSDVKTKREYINALCAELVYKGEGSQGRQLMEILTGWKFRNLRKIGRFFMIVDSAGASFVKYVFPGESVQLAAGEKIAFEWEIS